MCGQRHITTVTRRLPPKGYGGMSAVMRSIADNNRDNMLIFMTSSEDLNINKKDYMKPANVIKIKMELIQAYENSMNTMCLVPSGFNNLLTHMQSMNAAEMEELLRDRDL
jgi:hypothetical protein